MTVKHLAGSKANCNTQVFNECPQHADAINLRAITLSNVTDALTKDVALCMLSHRRRWCATHAQQKLPWQDQCRQQ